MTQEAVGFGDRFLDAAAQHSSEMSVGAYVDRIGVDPATVETPDVETLARLQRVHVTTVPFETLAITGDPYGERRGEGIVLAVPHLYEKIVERERGGYCFELNGLFHTLLAALGYEVHRAAARVVSAVQVPANHHVNVVELGRRYVVDVGIGPPMCRRPLPLDGTPQTDEVGIEWRVVASDRPDATYRVEFRRPGDGDWTPRYVFDDTPRPLRYFEATNDYLQSAPESPVHGGSDGRSFDGGGLPEAVEGHPRGEDPVWTARAHSDGGGMARPPGTKIWALLRHEPVGLNVSSVFCFISDTTSF